MSDVSIITLFNTYSEKRCNKYTKYADFAIYKIVNGFQ